MKATYKDNPNKNLLYDGTKIRMHVFEPEESVNQQDWYKDMTTFNNSKIVESYIYLAVGDVIEDDIGTRFRILSRHWKWEKDDENVITPVLEFTVERYMRHGKQNPYMI